MALTPEEIEELSIIINQRTGLGRSNPAGERKLREIACDPLKRRKQFKIVPGAQLSHRAAMLAQFYERAPVEQRAALDTLMALFLGRVSAEEATRGA